MKLYVKNMVCMRCIWVVQSVFGKLGLQPVSVQLGEVVLDDAIQEVPRQDIQSELNAFGFALLDDRKTILIERIKNLIVDLVHNRDSRLQTKLSYWLSSSLDQDYNYLSNLFAQLEGSTIEQYYIAQKIEKVKELLVYDELSLSEISYQLNYSSVSHLSKQFKKVSGFTPSRFKQLKSKKRHPIEEL